MTPWIEAELKSRPPRRTRRRAEYGRLIDWWHVVFLPPIVIAFWLDAHLLFILLHAQFGIQTDAVVTALSQHRRRNEDVYDVRFTYGQRGQPIFGSQRIPYEVYSGLLEGSRIQVKALTIGPFQHEIVVGAPPSPPTLIILLYTLSWNGFLFLSLYWSTLREPLRQRYLVRHGQPIPGQIVSKREASYQLRNRKHRTFWLGYSYTPENGPPLTGEVNVIEEIWRRAEVPYPSTILYDPHNTRRSTVYHYAEYEALTGAGES